MEDFCICTFQDGNIDFSKIKALATDLNLKDLIGSEVPQIDIEMSQSINFDVIRRESSIRPWKKEVLVIVGNRFGIKNVEKEYYSSIRRFMKLPSFVGLVGG